MNSLKENGVCIFESETYSVQREHRLAQVVHDQCKSNLRYWQVTGLISSSWSSSKELWEGARRGVVGVGFCTVFSPDRGHVHESIMGRGKGRVRVVGVMLIFVNRLAL